MVLKYTVSGLYGSRTLWMVDTEDGIMMVDSKKKRLCRQDSDGEESQSDFGDGREGGIAEKEWQLQGGTVCTAYSLHW